MGDLSRGGECRWRLFIGSVLCGLNSLYFSQIHFFTNFQKFLSRYRWLIGYVELYRIRLSNLEESAFYILVINYLV